MAYTYGAGTTINTSNISGATLTSTGAGATWTTPYVNSATSTITTYNDVYTVASGIDVRGTFKLNGVNIEKRLAQIEERLAILRPNTELEEKWENLKKLGDAYRALEKEIMEKEQIWDTLKK